MKKLMVLIIAALMMTGCASGPDINTYAPVVMNDDKSAAEYQQDITKCRQYATQRPDAATGAAEGGAAAGAIGAGIGAAVSAIRGSHHVGSNALLGAAIGFIGGAMKGAAIAHKRQKLIVIRCMEKKGWDILSD
jgi:hypothetical protein